MDIPQSMPEEGKKQRFSPLKIAKMAWRGLIIRRVVGIFFALSLLPASAQAIQFCEGGVERMLVSATGELQAFMSYRGDWTTLCSVTTTWNGISTNVCNNWAATLLSVNLASRSVVIAYDDGYTCPTLPVYNSSPAPLYVGIVP